MNKELVCTILNNALKDLYENDADIITEQYNIHERTVAHRLAMYLEKYFLDSHYKVDIEYNRYRRGYGATGEIDDIMAKQINWELADEGKRYVYPDIIVHKRDSDDNLLIIEVKMAWKSGNKHLDYKKINKYLTELNYRFGIYLELNEMKEECLIEFGPFQDVGETIEGPTH